METLKNDVIRINRVSLKDIPEKERKSAQFRMEKLSLLGRIMVFFGVMVFWIEKTEYHDDISTDTEYHFCSRFRKWHPLFLVGVIVSFLFHLVSSLLKAINNFFTDNPTDYFKLYRWRL
jgi:hypothetical protein